MEEVGFRVRNKDRIVQIDGLYKNHALLYKATVQPLESVFGDNSLRYIDIPIPASKFTPLVALRCDFACFYTQVNETIFRIFSRRTPSTETPPTVEVFVFGDPPSEVPPGAVGLRVRSKLTGEIVFDSNYKYLKVLGHYVNRETPVSDPIKFPGRKVAVVQGVRSYGAFTDRSGFVIIDSTYSGIITTPTQDSALYRYAIVRSFNLPWDGGSYPRYDFSSHANSYMVVDVTGF